MTDQPQTGNVPKLERYCPVCRGDNVHLLMQRSSVPIGTKVERGTHERSVVTTNADIYVCRSCGFLMFHAVGD